MTATSFQTINHVGINKDGTRMDIWMQLYVTGIRGYRGTGYCSLGNEPPMTILNRRLFHMYKEFDNPHERLHPVLRATCVFDSFRATLERPWGGGGGGGGGIVPHMGETMSYFYILSFPWKNEENNIFVLYFTSFFFFYYKPL